MCLISMGGKVEERGGKTYWRGDEPVNISNVEDLTIETSNRASRPSELHEDGCISKLLLSAMELQV